MTITLANLVDAEIDGQDAAVGQGIDVADIDDQFQFGCVFGS